MTMTKSNLNPSRRKRNERATNPKRMYKTARDELIIRLVYDYRILSQRQLERLLDKSRSTVQQSLVRLYEHEFLQRVFLPVSEFGSSPTLYILDKRGIEELRRMGIEDFRGIPTADISPMFKEHTLAINEFRIAITQACESAGWQVMTWKTENEIKADYDKVSVRTPKGKIQFVPIVPDAYFIVEIPNKGIAHFFLELDRGTMTLERFNTKVAGYVAYYKNGGFSKRFNAQGFRVLTVVDQVGKGRVQNLVQETAKLEGIGRRFWFAHLTDVSITTALRSPIWLVAGDDEPTMLFKSV